MISFNCSIGIVTYLGRYESYFKPLIRKVHFLFPDYDINVFINGHYDAVKQIRYLKDVTIFLRRYPHIRYVTNLEHQPLARGWNWLFLMSKWDKVLILNDDVYFNLEFRHNLESLKHIPDVCTLNGSWSHFIISKDIILKVGWFDERFLGVGHEDYDYICRLAFAGIPLKDIKIHGLHNYVAPQREAGWANFSTLVHGKYAQYNWEFFMKKWFHSFYEPVPEKGSLKFLYHNTEWIIAPKNTLEAMPQYYLPECLHSSSRAERNGIPLLSTCFSKSCSFLNSLYWRIRLALATWLRGLLGEKYDYLRRKLARS